MRNFYISILVLCSMLVGLRSQAQVSNSEKNLNAVVDAPSAYAIGEVDTLWFEGFEGGVLPEGWDTIITNSTVPGGGNSLGLPAYFTVTNLAPIAGEPFGNYHAGLWFDFSHQDEWLITKSFDCPEDAIFNFTSISVDSSRHGDHFYVKVSNDDGQNWTVLWDALEASAYAQNNYNWYYHIDLSDYAGQNIRLAFNATDAGNGLYHSVFVDNVSVTTGNPSGIEELALESRIYPNPAQTFVKVSSNQIIEQVNILKISGQKVQALKTVNNTEVRIDTENLSEGLYFIEVINVNGKTEKHKLMVAH